MSLIAMVDISVVIMVVACVVVPGTRARQREVPAALADLFGKPPAGGPDSVHPPSRLRTPGAVHPRHLTARRHRRLLERGPTLSQRVELVGRLSLFALRRVGQRMAWSLGQAPVALSASIAWLRARLARVADRRPPAPRYEQLYVGIWVLRYDRRPHRIVAATVAAVLAISLLAFGHGVAPAPVPDPKVPGLGPML